MYEWLLFLHVLAAFAYVGAYVWFTVVIVAGRRTDRATTTVALFRTVRVANVLAGIGGIGTIALGIWLTLYIGEYGLLDGWIVAAIVLWAATLELGRREGNVYAPAEARARELVAAGTSSSSELQALLRTSTGLALHVAGSAAVLAILWLMIYKPGA